MKKKVEISIRIPPGVESGTRLRASGEGEPSVEGGARGDLYCDIVVKEHEHFTRRGNDLLCETSITVPEAVLGTTLEVPTLDGKASLKIPAGTQPGTVFRLRGQGLPDLRGYGRGDILVKVDVDIPARPSGREEELYRELARVTGKGRSRKPGGFFKKVRDYFDHE